MKNTTTTRGFKVTYGTHRAGTACTVMAATCAEAMKAAAKLRSEGVQFVRVLMQHEGTWVAVDEVGS